jgi:excisionase family DNA binding protein
VRDELLTPAEVATWLQVPLSTLRIWRHRREGPPAVKVGRLLRYSRRDLETWLESRRQESVARAR